MWVMKKNGSTLIRVYSLRVVYNEHHKCDGDAWIVVADGSPATGSVGMKISNGYRTEYAAQKKLEQISEALSKTFVQIVFREQK
jgi:hypothetical protein